VPCVGLSILSGGHALLGDFGYAAAIAELSFLLIAVITLVNFLIIRRIRSAEA